MPVQSLSPETAYASKGNCAFPGTQAQATIAEGVAAARLAASAKQPLTVVNVAAGSIKVAN